MLHVLVFWLQVADVPELPAISLPISTAALPTFSFSSPLQPLNTSTGSSPKITAVSPIKEIVINKVRLKTSEPSSVTKLQVSVVN